MRSLRYRPYRDTNEPKKEPEVTPEETTDSSAPETSQVDTFEESVTIS
jgi:hypothetical protein